jgi:hypothetical protein
MVGMHRPPTSMTKAGQARNRTPRDGVHNAAFGVRANLL